MSEIHGTCRFRMKELLEDVQSAAKTDPAKSYVLFLLEDSLSAHSDIDGY